MVYIWCISHRLQLSLKDALRKKIEEFNDLNDFLKSLYLFQTNSNVVQAAVRNAVEVKNCWSSGWNQMDSSHNKCINKSTKHTGLPQDCLAALQNAENFSSSKKTKENILR